MFRAGRLSMLSIAVTHAACVTGQSVVVSPAVTPPKPKAPETSAVKAAPAADTIVCRFLIEDRTGVNEGCPAEQFIADEVTLLVRALEKDPDWGALISPEIERDGRFVIVANVVPSLQHFRRLRSGRVTPELASLVDSIQKMIENRLLRKTATFVRPDGTEVKATLQGGQLKGGQLNDYMEYLSQVAQDQGAEPFFMPYEDVTAEARAARTGLLWTVEARDRPDGSVEVELGIRTFEMELDTANRRLIVRGPPADRTGQLLGALYTVWRGNMVYPLGLTAPVSPPVAVKSDGPKPSAQSDVTPPPTSEPKEDASVAVPLGNVNVDPEPDVEALDGLPEAKKARERPPPAESNPTPKGERLRPRVSAPLRMTVARVWDTKAGKKRLGLGAGTLPSSGELFALVFISETPDSLAFLFGEAIEADAPKIAVPVASDETDKSAILGAPLQRFSLAMTSVFQYTGKEAPHVLVLRKNRPWSLREQGMDKWSCQNQPVVDGSRLPRAPFPTSPRLIDWIQEKMAEQMGEKWSFVEPEVAATDFSGIAVDRIPEGDDGVLCVWMPFDVPEENR